jgi:site-specific recombinase XerD
MAKVKIILYKSKILSDGSNPIMLRLTDKKDRKYFSLSFSANLNDWDEKNDRFKRSYINSKKINMILDRHELKAKEILINLESENKRFSFDEFEKRFIGSNDKMDVIGYFDETIQRLTKSGKIGNSYAYKDAKNVLLKYIDKKKIEFADVDYKCLNKISEKLLENQVKPSSISVYFRTIRALFNKAIKEGHCNEKNYPFDQYKISGLSTETVRRAIDIEKIKAINRIQSEPFSNLWNAKNYFMLSFFTMGMNFTDIAYLKYSNIEEDRIVYFRAKTGKPYSIKILEPALEIIKKYNSSGDEYIFPILSLDDNTPQKQKVKIKNQLKTVNKQLKIIAKEINFNSILTFYVARHSWATSLKRSGVSTSIISEGFKHDSEKTTQIYLDSFENKTLDDANLTVLENMKD